MSQATPCSSWKLRAISCKSSRSTWSRSRSSVQRTPSRTQSRIPRPVSTTARAFHSIRRKRRVRVIALWRPKNITSSPHGLDQRLIETAIDFTAQAVDVYLDNIRHPFPIGFPQVLAEHLPRHHLSGITHQELQQAELRGGHAQLGGAAHHVPVSEIERQRPDFEHGRRAVAGPANDRLQTGD